jgi:hypothetical protein
MLCLSCAPCCPIDAISRTSLDSLYGVFEEAKHFVQVCIYMAREREAQVTEITPLQHIKHAMIAQYFDDIFKQVLDEQSIKTTSLELCQPAFLPLLVSCAPLFLETDPQALKKYDSQYPLQTISVDILNSSFDKIEQEPMKNHGQEVLANILKKKMGEGLTGVAIDTEGRLASHFNNVQSGPQITENIFWSLE